MAIRQGWEPSRVAGCGSPRKRLEPDVTAGPTRTSQWAGACLRPTASLQGQRRRSGKGDERDSDRYTDAQDRQDADNARQPGDFPQLGQHGLIPLKCRPPARVREHANTRAAKPRKLLTTAVAGTAASAVRILAKDVMMGGDTRSDQDQTASERRALIKMLEAYLMNLWNQSGWVPSR